MMIRKPVIRILVAAAAILCLAGACAMAPAMAQTGFDRPGEEYARRPVPSGDPADCAMRCERDKRCQAWSFSYPAAGERAMCELKHAVPARVENPCCVSGVRGASVIEQRTTAIEMSTDRLGGDYRDFELKADANEDLCKSTCEGDNKCRAWTFVRAGYIGGAPRCFLKKEVKPPRRKPCCISGVVR